MKDTMLTYFSDVFGDKEDVNVYFAPGRVNLIGEHTDYNGGHVFPCALTIGTYGAVRPRKDNELRFYSMNFKEKGIITCSLDDISYNKEDDWANYPKAVLWAFDQLNIASIHKTINRGMDILIYGNIPNASGLSSSASIEVLTAYIARDLYKISVDMIDIARLCQYAENEYIGVKCGIMDQFAIAMGKKDHAIFLDTNTLEYEYAPINLLDAKIVIANTNKKRGLSDSKYNERREECNKALELLKTVVDIESLGELNQEDFDRYKAIINDDILIKRAKHAVSENIRTINGVQALEDNDLDTFGQLMNQSHISLRDDYDVTGIELDTLVEAAWKQDGVIGSRMTGAGFGGCTVSIVKSQYIDKFVEKVGEFYYNKIGYKADFYIVEIGDGPSKL